MSENMKQNKIGKRFHVLLFIPNIIGYVRLILLCFAWYCIELPIAFLLCYIPSALLDVVDGYAARKLNQVSDFGAWLDVVVDIIGRGVLWCNISKFGYAVPALEWLVFVANHARSNSGQWRENFRKAPKIVQHVMKDGFRTVLGLLVICGIHILPLWLYAELHFEFIAFLSPVISFCVFSLLLIGRMFGLVAELWCVYVHIIYLLDKDEND